jgi:hypothetical protein
VEAAPFQGGEGSCPRKWVCDSIKNVQTDEITITIESAKMNLEKIRSNFKIINPHGSDGEDLDDRNPLGNCSACASLAGRHLVSGTNPTQPAGELINIGEVHRNDLVIRRFPLGEGKEAAQKVWTWFSTEATNGVYLVEQEGDHCFNLVKDGYGVYLIDSNLHIFQELVSRESAKIDGYNYIYPKPEEDNDFLVFYYLGHLHPIWM